MPVKTIKDTCTACQHRVDVPVDAFLVVYHREDSELDRLQWQHAGCPAKDKSALNIKPYTEAIAKLLAPVLEAGLIRATFRDPELADAARRNTDKINEEYIASVIRWASSPATPVD